MSWPRSPNSRDGLLTSLRRRQAAAQPGSAGREPEPVSGVRLYWAQNDGMSGHVFLSPIELADLGREMDRQGMPELNLEPGERVPPGRIDLALAKASPEPLTLEDGKLWADWLAFLGGAAEHGGLVVQ